MKKQCPDDEILADYMEDRLSAEDRLFLDAHLSDCDACLENLVMGKALEWNMEQFESEPVPHYLTQSAMHLVDDLNIPLIEKTGRAVKKICSAISDYLVPDFEYNRPLAAIRGRNHAASDNCKQVTKNFKGIKTKIEFEKSYSDQEEPEHKNIRVSLIPHNSPQPAIRVSLIRGEREFFSYLLNQKHMLFEEKIPPGEYHLIFTKDGSKIGEYVFTNKP